ncbi:hypothetical protein FRC20_007148 [Serendipita sp. 405]|nr:hypothetical protein FRC16_009970 [Serendipita sp. 398]KAG8866926.1 hypothetical protein FRC20_007148 [Serendipita sp. 405]
MPSLPIQVIQGQNHSRVGRSRALTTAPRRGSAELAQWFERWMVYAQRCKIAFLGVAAGAVAVYCPPTPFASARARRSNLRDQSGEARIDSESQCRFSRATCHRELPTTAEQDAKNATSSLQKFKFKWDAYENTRRNPPE